MEQLITNDTYIKYITACKLVSEGDSQGIIRKSSNNSSISCLTYILDMIPVGPRYYRNDRGMSDTYCSYLMYYTLRNKLPLYVEYINELDLKVTFLAVPSDKNMYIVYLCVLNEPEIVTSNVSVHNLWYNIVINQLKINRLYCLKSKFNEFTDEKEWYYGTSIYILNVNYFDEKINSVLVRLGLVPEEQDRILNNTVYRTVITI